jgi:hypothetical protein
VFCSVFFIGFFFHPFFTSSLVSLFFFLHVLPWHMPMSDLLIMATAALILDERNHEMYNSTLHIQAFPLYLEVVRRPEGLRRLEL